MKAPTIDPLAPVVKQLMDSYRAAIEARLEDLVGRGIAVARISLQHHPDGKTVIAVDGIPNSEFFFE